MPPFVIQLDAKQQKQLHNDLKEQGFTLTTPNYTVFQAKKPGLTATLYTSGKLVVQGKATEEWLEFYLEPELLQSLVHTAPLTLQNTTPRIGIDEAGKGDFFGPLCIGGVFADEKGLGLLVQWGVKDSKKMSDQKILDLAKKIKKHLPFHVVEIFPYKYNELYQKFGNLNHLLGWGHATCIEQLSQTTKCTNVIIDQFGREEIVLYQLKRKKLLIDLEQRHKGEEDLVVAAASIVARASFLEGLAFLGEKVHSELKKGASQQVITLGRKLYQELGEEMLKKLAKAHFKTWNEVTGNGA